MMVNVWDRWIYKGSVTTPPCDEYVYWNVLRTVYPIKQSTLDLFKKQMARTKSYDLLSVGNWREVQPVNLHDIYIVQQPGGGSGILINIISLLLIIGIIFVGFKYYKLKTGS